MRVLLADDSLTMRTVLASRLKRWDYEVTEVDDGQQAWEEFQRDPFSLVLTDWVMPNVDGVELIRRIRESAEHRYVYIVLLTTRSGKEDLVHAMETGADDFLSKPCNTEELRVRLRAGERIIDLEHTLLEQNQQLKQAQAALVQSEKLAGVGQLAAGMAHEINNPLAFVSNNMAVLRRDVASLIDLVDLYVKSETMPDDAELRTSIEAARRDCDLPWLKENLPQLFHSTRDGLGRVREIVSNLRDFAHLDEAEIDHMCVAAAVESTLQILSSNFDSKRLTVQRHVTSSPQIYCQPAKIKQVIHALLRNAVQASSEGQTITVRVGHDDSSAWIEVADEGHGMDETTQNRVFEPFYTTRPVGSGQGLGMAIAYGIVHQHGGSIEFESAPGQGTAFRVTLPKLQGSA